MKTKQILFLFGALLLWANTPSQAAPLTLNQLPDLNAFEANPVNVSYNAATGEFQAVGVDEFYGYYDSLLIYDNAATLTLDATINNAGVLTGGTISITGDLGDGLETLLTGDLITGPSGIAFGFTDPPITNIGGGNIFNFIFTITGGDTNLVVSMNDFGPGLFGGIHVDANFEGGQKLGDIPFNGTWTSDFNNNGGTDQGSGNVTAFPIIPEPSSVSLTLMGSALFVAAYHRRRQNKTTHSE